MKSLTILPLADTPNLIVREIESYDVKAFSGFMMQPRYQRYTAMRLRSDAEVAAFVLRSVARRGESSSIAFLRESSVSAGVSSFPQKACSL